MLLVVKPTHAVERIAGSDEVRGSIPLGSTKLNRTVANRLLFLIGGEYSRERTARRGVPRARNDVEEHGV
jgi:hypothetical protein